MAALIYVLGGLCVPLLAMGAVRLLWCAARIAVRAWLDHSDRMPETGCIDWRRVAP